MVEDNFSFLHGMGPDIEEGGGAELAEEGEDIFIVDDEGAIDGEGQDGF